MARSSCSTASGRLAWVSDDLKAVLGEEDEDELGYGEHILSRYQRAPWRALVTDESAARAFRRNVPYIADATPGGVDALRRFAGDELAAVLEHLKPEPAPAAWAFDMELLEGGVPAGRAWCYSARLYDEEGDFFGIVRLYTQGMPARLLAIAARGDETLFERMAQVAEPRARPLAVLFADLDASGVLARRLAGAAYFRLISAVSAAIDRAVIERAGSSASTPAMARRRSSLRSSWDRTRPRRAPRRRASCRRSPGRRWSRCGSAGRYRCGGRTASSMSASIGGFRVHRPARDERPRQGHGAR